MRGEEEKLKAMTTKEREEHKKMGGRLTGGRVERFFGCRCQSSVLQDVNFSSATRTLLRPMLLYGRWNRVRRYKSVRANSTSGGRREDRLEFSDSD